MSTRSDWINDRLGENINNKLTQGHVVDTMLEADRPFFTITQLESRLKPDVDRGTIRNRLDELREIDIVAEDYLKATTIYYINHPESNWPLSPEGKEALQHGTPLENLSLRGLITFSDADAIRSLALASMYLGFMLVFIGALTSGVESPIHVEAESQVMIAGITVMFLAPTLLFALSVANWIRSQNWWRPDRIRTITTELRSD
ncbi:hypothetical protein G6M89_20835 [Natronolimnobius sp. AArcel1]|uniref:hypothetical protein n=1 Tax=Natronolimnobius sp. AArcel1 TaxID=1679093 RepID=UPI0013EC369C|nr:hypothetical protein [Natronolimnobius sp. AArcel1]NGM71408.1 hypothetical protein [Natronolimnobius sp. AArcel1]